MNTELTPTPKISPAQVAAKAIATCEARYGVSVQYREIPPAYFLCVQGPAETVNLTACLPLRAGTLEAACRLVSEDNTSPLGGAA